MKNSITLMGRIGKDPEFKTLQGGENVVNLSMATSETYKDKSGEKKQITEWHSLTAWGEKAEMLSKYVKKGDLLMIDGKLTYQKWEKDNVKHERAVIKIDKVYFMPNRSETKNDLKHDVKQEEKDNDLSF